ncbi:glycosyltransferase family 4 protein [Arhodomonas aquaeolei]|uniref:glycosyltransferase family 4 protein n=1 Tax=Arhodomonas aquaeolei TaxID=2369 RepID=UPI0003AB3465|nr:glycosyltransferase family 4 protein [Arhodomonas aquaeolei]
MRILFLSDNFPPETNAPATRLYEHAVEWVRAGDEVTVITCAPNFPEGKVFPGYRNRWYSVENVDGIRVVRVKTFITANEGFVKRTLDYVSFMLAGAAAAVFQKRPDVVVATSPQFFAAVGGWLVSVLRRRPFVFELRDLWPASIVAVGALDQSRAVRVLERLELFLYGRARRIVAVTESFRKDLIRRGVPEGKIDVVRNGVDLERFQSAEPDQSLAQELDLEGKFVVGYVGTHGMAHALEKVIDAAELLRNRDDIAFLFVGSGAAKGQVDGLIRDKQLTNVRSLPRQAKERVPAISALCDTAVIPLRDSPVFESVIPSKLFECMAMGTPVVMALPEGEATGLVREYGVGVCVPPEDPEALAAAVQDLADSPDRRIGFRDGGLAAAPVFARVRQAQRMRGSLDAAVDRI